MHTLIAHKGIVKNAVFSPDDQNIVSYGYNDHRIRIWNVQLGMLLHEIKGEYAVINC